MYVATVYGLLLCYFAEADKLVVRERNLEHNHRLGLNIAAHYSANRKLTKAQKDEVNEILRLKPNKACEEND